MASSIYERMTWFIKLAPLHRPVNGIHIITNMRSLMARLMIRMFVVERISGLKATTNEESKRMERRKEKLVYHDLQSLNVMLTHQ